MSASLKKYKHAFNISQQILDALEADTFPIDIKEAYTCLHNTKIFLTSVGYFNECSQSSNPINFVPLFIQDAKCIRYNENTYLVVYNENMPPSRIRFSLAHEFGHIILKHLDDERTEIYRGGLDDRTYYAMEGAANTFAGNFLAPPILIHDWLCGAQFDIESIAQRFDISTTSVRDYRASDYEHWLTMPHSKSEFSILERCKTSLHIRSCPSCNAVFSIKGAHFCPICGEDALGVTPTGKENIYMFYPKVPLRIDGHVLLCPNCQNEEHLDGSTFCMICGKPTVNQCTYAIDYSAQGYAGQCQHDEALPGNARFCPYCGSRTTFLENDVIPDWTQVPSAESDVPWERTEF